MAKQFPMQQLSDFTANPFRDVGHMCQALDIEQSKYGLGWRLTDYALGMIHGLPQSRGRIAASDGMLCIIITESGHYIGHHEWFELEKQPREQRISISSAKETSTKVSIKKQAILTELNALLDL